MRSELCCRIPKIPHIDLSQSPHLSSSPAKLHTFHSLNSSRIPETPFVVHRTVSTRSARLRHRGALKQAAQRQLDFECVANTRLPESLKADGRQVRKNCHGHDAIHPSFFCSFLFVPHRCPVGLGALSRFDRIRSQHAKRAEAVVENEQCFPS